MGGGGSNLWSVWEADRWAWFTRKVFEFSEKKNPHAGWGARVSIPAYLYLNYAQAPPPTRERTRYAFIV
jgi:hypothetical protein